MNLNFGNALKGLFRPELIIPAVAGFAFGPQAATVAKAAVGFMGKPDKDKTGGYFGSEKEGLHTSSYYGAISSKAVASPPRTQVNSIRDILQLQKYDNNRRMQLALLNSVQNNQFWKSISNRNKIDLGHDVYAKSTATAASAPNIKLET